MLLFTTGDGRLLYGILLTVNSKLCNSLTALLTPLKYKFAMLKIILSEGRSLQIIFTRQNLFTAWDEPMQ